MRNNYPLMDAHVVSQLKAAGAIILGKTNMGELAFFPSFCISSLGGTVRNPYHLAYTSAGSSGGSAAGIAAGFGIAALGTDTGNSVRGPASHTALVGLRPSLGLVGRSGIVPLRYDRDTVGPLARSVRDAAILLGVMAGQDPGDNFTQPLLKGFLIPNGTNVSATEPPPRDYLQYLDAQGLKGARIGVFSQILQLPGANAGVLRLFYDALGAMQDAGAILVDDFQIMGNALGQDWDANRDGEGPALGHWNVGGTWEDLWACQSPLR